MVAPQFSVLTVRVSGPAAGEQASFTPAGSDKDVLLTPDKPTAEKDAAKPVATAPESASYTVKLARDGSFALGAINFAFKLTPDEAPTIRFDKEPDRAVNGALEIAFAAGDDYGITEARAEIKPVDQDPKAIALFELPVFRLDVPGNAKSVKATASRDLTEHPLSGKKVAVTLVARDAAGHEARSETKTILMPQRIFTQALAGSIAEQRQVFALDVNKVPKALQLSEIAGFRADETIPNLSHYLMLESTRNRLRLADTVPALEETSGYFWDVARYIEDGDLSNAEKRLRDAQQKLSEALSRNASDKEIEALMKELREAMKTYLSELAKRMGNPENNQMASQPQKMMRAQDIDKMLNQLENLARSGSREEAQKLLSEMQRMMNNLQTARPQNQRQPGDNPMRDQIDRLGELMQKQQKLMEETHRLEQTLRDRMQRGDPRDEQGLNNEDPFQDMTPPGEEEQPQAGDPNGKEPSPEDKMTADQLREALKALKERQAQLQKDLKGMEKKLSELGMKPMPGFGEAGKEMGESSDALGKSQGQRSADAQGRALEALRKGAGEMMQQLQQAGEGQGQGMGMPGQQADGADPLGRRPGQMGGDIDEQVKVPDQIDIQRAREILEEIRKRLGDGPASIIERDYLERLLDLK
ncbi:TIGR02302 family protein [Rhizobium sp. G21]|uniref:TIGR02302 family protein n=1 Tax=Rhizobium sp. G21 TaxID=2758439 RepID=UPI0028A8F6C0|nr:TIGR02302 family protein [Rhizobium sp. G21]